MADVTIDDLTAATAPATTDLYEIDQGGTSKKISAEIQSRLPRIVNTQTGSTYTFALTDGGGLVIGNRATGQTFTVPPNSSVAFPVNTQIDILQFGAGQITIAAGSGVTVSSKDANLKLTGQYSAGTLIKQATDVWVLVGDLAA